MPLLRTGESRLYIIAEQRNLARKDVIRRRSPIAQQRRDAEVELLLGGRQASTLALESAEPWRSSWLVTPASRGQGPGASVFGRRATKHSGYAPSRMSVSTTSYAAAAKRMLGEPMTPLFSIIDFISLESNQVRAFDTSATS
jgi:hypothetical protein